MQCTDGWRLFTTVKFTQANVCGEICCERVEKKKPRNDCGISTEWGKMQRYHEKYVGYFSTADDNRSHWFSIYSPQINKFQLPRINNALVSGFDGKFEKKLSFLYGFGVKYVTQKKSYRIHNSDLCRTNSHWNRVACLTLMSRFVANSVEMKWAKRKFWLPNNMTFEFLKWSNYVQFTMSHSLFEIL